MSETNYIERYWRDATPADAIKEPPMVARFWDFDCDDWQVGNLLGFTRATEDYPPWFSETGEAFDKCQVYDAPDPGEGWRLVDTQNEKPEYGDEYYSSDGEWILRALPLYRWTGQDIYRRRITPVVTYVPFTWEEREQLRGRWIRFIENGKECEMICDRFAREVGGNGLVILHRSADWLCSNAIFLDTGKPVGKEVTQ